MFDTPANTFVATFIGSPSMNLMEARAVEGGLAVPGGRVPIDAPGDVTLGVRPHDVKLGAGAVSARVDVVESLGAEALIHLVCEGDHTLVAQVPEPSPWKSGDAVQLSFERTHLFDSATGQRL